MPITVQQVETYNYKSKEDFQEYIKDNRRPLLIPNVDIGECCKKWTVDYLAKVLGKNEVRVHVSPVGHMSFLNKNFTYKTLPFEEFIRRAAEERNTKWFICENECYYLRSIGSDKRGKDVADVNKQFPQISSDIKFPKLFDDGDFFSSVFRIGSCGVQIWTHYDVMDNMLIQIVDFLKAIQYECILKPGDVLYIPALWHHNTVAKSFGIGVNVFWKNLPHELYDKTDVYGNKDLVPAAKALTEINKAVISLKSLPPVYKEFYIQRAISVLERAKQ
ncbi:tRNA wybutosine-synthesizing protein 5-like isoform X2 [Rhodnius prolixus]|uniref:tRNA wybutosine-synthesizing protein 5-like isoform X2 n=1 Tax=Rhodnius prolixus TaxID=13249 RepID=UPI003D18C529